MNAHNYVCDNDRCTHHGSVTQEIALDPSSEDVLDCEMCGKPMTRLTPVREVANSDQNVYYETHRADRTCTWFSVSRSHCEERFGLVKSSSPDGRV